VQTPFYESTGGGAPLTTGYFLKPLHGESQETQRSKPMILFSSLSYVRTSFVVEPEFHSRVDDDCTFCVLTSVPSVVQNAI